MLGSNYQALLMLSGGKDSCSLALKLKDEGIEFLCFTLDTGFISDIAKQNIDKLTKSIDVDSIILKPRQSEYIKFIRANLSLKETCSFCSLSTFNYAIDTAEKYGIKTIYAGFNKFTAQAQDWQIRSEFKLGNITIKYPYEETYNYPEIKQRMIMLGLEYDPTKTNCQYIRDLIKRDKDNCFENEIKLMFKEGQIDDAEYNYYTEFLQSCRVS